MDNTISGVNNSTSILQAERSIQLKNLVDGLAHYFHISLHSTLFEHTAPKLLKKFGRSFEVTFNLIAGIKHILKIFYNILCHLFPFIRRLTVWYG